MNTCIYRPIGILGTVIEANTSATALQRPYLKRSALPPPGASVLALVEAKRLLEVALNRRQGELSDASSEDTVNTGSRTAGVQVLDIFGPATEAAVKDFQARGSLAANGALDDATWSALLNKKVTTWGGSAPYLSAMIIPSAYKPGMTTASTNPPVAASIPAGAYCVQQNVQGALGLGSMVKPGEGGTCPAGFKLVVPRADASFGTTDSDPRAAAKTKIATLSDSTLLGAIKAVKSGMGYGDERFEELLAVRDLLMLEASKRNLTVPEGSDVSLSYGASVGSSKSASTATPTDEKKTNWVLPALGGALVLGFFLLRKRA